jgi:VWFA-related protein
MPKFFYITLIFIVLTAIAFAQRPTPSPKSDDDVVKISTNLIQVDVTVLDKSGKVVRDLRPEEFQVFENGKKQDISNFSFISAARETVTERPDKNAPQAVLPPPPVRPERVRRTIALVIDDLSLSFESTYYARRAVKKFVDEQMQDGDLVAIIRTGAGIGALQQFTTDKRQLYAAIEKIRWNPVGTGGIGAFAAMEAPGPTPLPSEGDEDAGVRTPEGIQREQESTRTSIFATGTLGAINYVVRGMQELPGRKSILLVSDGFKLFEEDALGFKESGRVLDSLRRLVDAANRASVVVHTLDARGLQYTGLTAADDTGGRSAQQIEEQLGRRRGELIDTQDGLRYLAAQTGGTSVYNNNDLSGGIRKILDDQSYYLIGFVPDEETFDPSIRRFSKLEVRVTRPGVKVRYRSGFFGVSNEKMKAVATAGPTGRAKILNALTSPFSVGQIPIRFNAIFNADANGAAYVRSLLHIDLRQIKFEELPDKTRKAVVEILVVAFGDNGVVVDQSAQSYTMTFPKDVYERLYKEGVVHTVTFPVKKPGAYQLRVAVRDTGTDNVGSANQFLDVPNIKKGRLLLSGVVLENISLTEWQRRNDPNAVVKPSTVFSDTSARQFRKATVVNYGFTVFNPKSGSVEGGNVEWQMRLFRDGKVIFEGKPRTAMSAVDAKARSTNIAGSLMLGGEMLPGDYVIQITVTDKLRKAKQNSVSQFVQFEIVEE